MNATLELMRAHGSVRKYLPGPVLEDDLRRAVAAAQCASTSSAVQSYSVLRVTDSIARERLAELTGNQPMVAAAGAFLVIAGDTRRHRIACADAGRDYAAGLEAFLLAVIDASLFAQNLALALESLGYGICFVGGLRNDLPEVDRLLRVPEGIYPLYGLCVGQPARAPGHRPRLAVDAVLHDDAWPDEAAVRAALAEYDERYRDYRSQRGAEPVGWAEVMGLKFSRRERAELAAYYASKGADLG